MAEIKWVTPIATTTAIAESERKRELEKVSALFELWRKQHPHDTEVDWLFYSGRQGHSFATGQTRMGQLSDNYKDWNALWTITQKPKKTKKEHMTYLPPEKLDTSHRKSDDRMSV